MRMILVALVALLPMTASAADDEDTRKCMEDKEQTEKYLNDAGLISAEYIVTGCTTSWRKDKWSCKERMKNLEKNVRTARFYYGQWTQYRCFSKQCISVPISGRTHMEWISEGHRC